MAYVLIGAYNATKDSMMALLMVHVTSLIYTWSDTSLTINTTLY